jgi:hypothetical protein
MGIEFNAERQAYVTEFTVGFCSYFAKGPTKVRRNKLLDLILLFKLFSLIN